MQKYLKSPSKQQYSKSEPRWNSERICCRRDEVPTEPALPKETKLDSKESSLLLSDGVAYPPFVSRDFKLDSRDISIKFNKHDDGDKSAINRSVISGDFAKECHKYKPCEKKMMRNLNEFFLQSKDFERFNVDFKYQ